MTATTMSEALDKSGVAIGRSAAYVAAVECLVGSEGFIVDAVPAFYERLIEDSAALVEVVGETQIRVACLGYLERVAADMNNSASGGHFPGDTHPDPAPDSPKRGADGGHLSSDAHPSPASTAPQPIANGEGQTPGGTHAETARPVREPSKGQIIAAKRAAVVQAGSVFDTFRITERQGSRVAVGDVKAHAWGRMARNNVKSTYVKAMETELCLIMAAYVDKQAHVPAGADTRDILSKEIMEAAIEESKRIAGYQSRITSVIQEIAHVG